MPIRPSPLQLEHYWVEELSYWTMPDFKCDLENLGLENLLATVTPADLTVKTAFSEHKEERLRRTCELTIELWDATGSKFPYGFHVRLIGFFRISEQYQAEDIDLMFMTNAPALLYSAARELLVLVTGRGSYAPVTLPSVTFLPSTSESSKPPLARARDGRDSRKPPPMRKASKKSAKTTPRTRR